MPACGPLPVIALDIQTMIDPSEICKILKAVRDRITDETDIVWSRYKSPLEARQDINNEIQRLDSGDISGLSKLNLLFGPTGAFQEISISNGWGDEFIKLSTAFDKHYENMRIDKSRT